jgi:hypothetical protein
MYGGIYLTKTKTGSSRVLMRRKGIFAVQTGNRKFVFFHF